MSIPIECPACEHTFSVPTRYGGKKGKCPECGNVFEAPKTADLEAVTPRPSSQPPTPPTNGESNSAELRIPLPSKVAQRVPTRIPQAPPIDQSSPIDQSPPIHQSPPIDRNGTNTSLDDDPPVSPFSNFVNNSELPTTAPAKPNSQEPPLPRNQPRRSNAPLFAATGVLVILVLAGLVGIVMLDPFASDSSPEDSGNKNGNQSLAQNSDNNSAADDDRIKTTVTPPAKMPTDEELKTLWQDVLPFICQVIVETPSGTSSHAGFVIDTRGWVATNHHVINNARKIQIRFGAADDSATPVEARGVGIIATSSEHDLAIIAIESNDAKSFLQLSLNPDEALVTDDYALAVGYAEGGDGLYAHSQIKGLVPTSRLAPSNHAFLRERNLDVSKDLKLIEHSRRVIQGVGGGPLLNFKGEAIGVNVQLSPNSKTGYAIPIEHLVALRSSASGDVIPFAGAVDTSVATASNPMSKAADKSKTGIKTGTWDSIDLIKKLHDEFTAKSWLPRTAAEYEDLQKLTRHVHDAKEKRDDLTIEEGLRDFLDVRSQEVLDELSVTKWKDDAELAEINNLAAAGLDSPEPGFFAYGKVVVPSLASQKLDDVPTVVFELIGTDTWVVLTIRENARALRKGTRWLILGVQDPETNIGIATSDPDDPEKIVSLIHSKFLVGEPVPEDE